MTRRPDHIPARKPFPKAVKAAILKRSNGMCEAPDCNRPGKDFDHVKAVAFGGKSTEDNCQLLCRECNAAKGIEEARNAAKADRAGGRSGQKARRDRAKANGMHRPIGSKKMGSQPWPKHGRKIPSRKFGGREEKR